VTLRARWVTLRAHWVTLRARWVTLRARWVKLRARWVIVVFQVTDLLHGGEVAESSTALFGGEPSGTGYHLPHNGDSESTNGTFTVVFTGSEAFAQAIRIESFVRAQPFPHCPYEWVTLSRKRRSRVHTRAHHGCRKPSSGLKFSAKDPLKFGISRRGACRTAPTPSAAPRGAASSPRAVCVCVCVCVSRCARGRGAPHHHPRR
jgi:hypothetical protein